MTPDATRLVKNVRMGATIVGALMVMGILTLMLLARGTGEDITGIVAPALLVALVSAVVAIVAAVLERRGRRGVVR